MWPKFRQRRSYEFTAGSPCDPDHVLGAVVGSVDIAGVDGRRDRVERFANMCASLRAIVFERSGC